MEAIEHAVPIALDTGSHFRIVAKQLEHVIQPAEIHVRLHVAMRSCGVSVYGLNVRLSAVRQPINHGL